MILDMCVAFAFRFPLLFTFEAIAEPVVVAAFSAVLFFTTMGNVGAFFFNLL